MMTVNEVSKLTGVSVRTLQYYDKIGLLHPTEYTQAGYRLYDDTTLEKLQQILLFRELEFPLKDIREIMESPSFDRGKALEQQITLLSLKREHLDRLIDLARGIKKIGVRNMDFSAFDTRKIDEYAAEAKASWGTTTAYHEYEGNYTCSDEILAGLGKMYTGNGEFSANIDKAGGAGTAEFTGKAIEIYCGR